MCVQKREAGSEAKDGGKKDERLRLDARNSNEKSRRRMGSEEILLKVCVKERQTQKEARLTPQQR